MVSYSSPLLYIAAVSLPALVRAVTSTPTDVPTSTPTTSSPTYGPASESTVATIFTTILIGIFLILVGYFVYGNKTYAEDLEEKMKLEDDGGETILIDNADRLRDFKRNLKDIDRMTPTESVASETTPLVAETANTGLI
jgi:cbb3-type cytochrome oxidase subunit 3